MTSHSRDFMRRCPRFHRGPWRAVPVLGVTQIISWGTIYYTPVLIVPLIADERGWSISFAMGGFSVGLLVAGLDLALCRARDRPLRRPRGDGLGSLIGALGLVLITHAAGQPAISRCGGARRRHGGEPLRCRFRQRSAASSASARARPITALTLAGGFASTVSWPATHFLLEAVGWRGTYLVYAALLALRLGAAARARAAAQRRAEAQKPARRSAGAGEGAAAVWLAVYAGGGGLRFLRLRALGPVRASAGDLRARRHRCRHGGVDRRAVRPGAGRRAADRIRLRPQCASACGWRVSRLGRCSAPSPC